MIPLFLLQVFILQEDNAPVVSPLLLLLHDWRFLLIVSLGLLCLLGVMICFAVSIRILLKQAQAEDVDPPTGPGLALDFVSEESR